MVVVGVGARFQMLVTSFPLRRTYISTHSISNSIWKKKITPSSSTSTFPISTLSSNPIAKTYHRTRPLSSVLYCTAPNANAATVTEESPSSGNDATQNENDVEKDEIKDAGNVLDLRVGRIIKAWQHEEADTLYVEEVDVGEAEPRIICSGLVNYIPLNLLQDALVVVLANLKPRNMRGVKSCGMLMAASDESHENVELLIPPEGSVPGDRIWFGVEDDKDNLPEPSKPNQVQKKKIWESVQPHLKTDESCVAMLGEHFMQSPAGVVTTKSLKNARIS